MSKCGQCIIKRLNPLKCLTHDELEKFSNHKLEIRVIILDFDGKPVFDSNKNRIHVFKGE